MPTTATTTEEEMTFFGLTTTRPAFLQKHGIYYARQEEEGSLFAEQADAESPARVYWLQYPMQLRLLRQADLQSLCGINDVQTTSLDEVSLEDLIDGPTLGQLVYRAYSEDVDTRNGLAHFAADEVKRRGVTSASARWMMWLVEAAFGGSKQRIEFSEKGVFLIPDAIYGTIETTKRQLLTLQKVNALRFEAVRGIGFHLRFNHELVKPINAALMPAFFQDLVY